MKGKSSNHIQAQAKTFSKRSKEHRFKARLTSPGVIYNAGNLLALFGGMLLGLCAAPRGDSVVQTLQNHFLGSVDAVWLSVAMLLFILSGEIYERANRRDASPVLLPLADLASAVAAMALTVALVVLGDTTVALLAGLMLTMGKLGSAVLPLFGPESVLKLDKTLRCLVVASRAPSLLALAMSVLSILRGTASMELIYMPLLMIVCFILWLYADLLLMKQNSPSI